MSHMSVYSITVERLNQAQLVQPPLNMYGIRVDTEVLGSYRLQGINARQLGMRTDAAADLFCTAVHRTIKMLHVCDSPLLAHFCDFITTGIEQFGRRSDASVQETKRQFIFNIADPVVHRFSLKVALACGDALRQPPNMCSNLIPLVYLLRTLVMGGYKKKAPAEDAFYSAVNWTTLYSAVNMLHLHQERSTYARLWAPYQMAIDNVTSTTTIPDQDHKLKAVTYLKRRAIKDAIYNHCLYLGSSGDPADIAGEIITRSYSELLNHVMQLLSAETDDDALEDMTP